MTDAFDRKIARMLTEAVNALDPVDRAERVLYCYQTGEHGCRAYPEGAAVRFTWGGRDLVLVERELLADDDAELPVGEFIDTPDLVPPEWG